MRDSIRKGFQLRMRHHKLNSLTMRRAEQDQRKICGMEFRFRDYSCNGREAGNVNHLDHCQTSNPEKRRHRVQAIPLRKKHGPVMAIWPGSMLYCFVSLKEPWYEDFDTECLGNRFTYMDTRMWSWNLKQRKMPFRVKNRRHHF